MTLNITPQPALRPRVTKRGTFNPPKYTNYKNALKLMLKQMYKSEPIEHTIRLHVNFYLPIPKMSKKKHQEHLGKAHYKKPDLDNLIKGVMDSMNGIVYKDDNIVSGIVANKFYSEEPRIEFNIECMA